jgi:quinolinate synthase
MLDLLRRGEGPDLNRVLPGDIVNETTGSRERLSEREREKIVRFARASLERMIDVTRRSA